MQRASANSWGAFILKQNLLKIIAETNSKASELGLDPLNFLGVRKNMIMTFSSQYVTALIIAVDTEFTADIQINIYTEALSK